MNDKLLISRGRVIDPASKTDGIRDVLLENGRIVEISEAPLTVKAQKVDAQGLWVTPGFVDLHVHLREPGEEGKETIETGSRAAAAGGFTAVVAMPNTRPVIDSALTVQFVLGKAKAAGSCQVYCSGAVTRGQLGEQLAELAALVDAGCVALTDDGHPLMNAALMRRALLYARPLGVPVMIHAEDRTLSAGGCAHDGPTAARLGLLPIPASAEVAMVARDLVLAEETRGRLHVAHVSCAQSVDLIREAKRRGVRVTAEATPHHFTLTERAIDGYDTHAKMNPPLREGVDVEAVRAGLADRTIDAIATDHAPHGVLDKQCEFDKAMNGVVGLETALPLTLALVREGVLTPLQAIERLTLGPAQAFALPAGRLQKGGAADLTLLDPDAAWTVDPTRFFSKGRNTPFAGWQVKGRVLRTYLEGRQVFGPQAPR